jgi:hypothetical protein
VSADWIPRLPNLPSTDAFCAALKAGGVDSRRVAVIRRFIDNPDVLPCDQYRQIHTTWDQRTEP